MKQIFQKIAQNKRLMIVYVILELMVAYILASLAIDTAHLIYYLLFGLLVFDAVNKIIVICKKNKNNGKKTGKSKKA